MTAVTIAVIDDHPLIVSTLTSLLACEGFAILGRAKTARDGVRMIVRNRPKLAVVDLRLPDGSGLEVLRDEGVRESGVAIVFYTSSIAPGTARTAIADGARAVVLKDAPPTNLLHALSEVLAGRTYLDPRLTEEAKPS